MPSVQCPSVLFVFKSLSICVIGVQMFVHLCYWCSVVCPSVLLVFKCLSICVIGVQVFVHLCYWCSSVCPSVLLVSKCLFTCVIGVQVCVHLFMCVEHLLLFLLFSVLQPERLRLYDVLPERWPRHRSTDR